MHTPHTLYTHIHTPRLTNIPCPNLTHPHALLSLSLLLL